ncbi:hypothetical protein [Mesorhizobium sp.]|nr:hypothetical protein [Mesorhizobium sp.]
MDAGENVSKLADEVGISRQRLYEWHTRHCRTSSEHRSTPR